MAGFEKYWDSKIINDMILKLLIILVVSNGAWITNHHVECYGGSELQYFLDYSNRVSRGSIYSLTAHIAHIAHIAHQYRCDHSEV